MKSVLKEAGQQDTPEMHVPMNQVIYRKKKTIFTLEYFEPLKLIFGH